MATLGDENIGGFDVPMNDPLAVGRIERVGNLASPIQQLFERKWMASNPMLQGSGLPKTPSR